MELVYFIFDMFAKLVIVTKQTVIFQHSGLTFTLFSLAITILVINIILDIAFIFMSPKTNNSSYSILKRNKFLRSKIR